MKKIIRFIKDRDRFIIFALLVGILTYMVGLRDRAEAEAFENEQNKIKNKIKGFKEDKDYFIDERDMYELDNLIQKLKEK